MAHYLTRLPPEIIAQIFFYVDECCLRNVRLVCSTWKEIVDDMFCKFNGFLTDDNFKYILNSKVKFETLQVFDFKFDKLDESLTSGSMSRNKLALFPRKLLFKGNPACSLCPSVSAKNMASILKLNRDVEELSFEANSLKCVKSLKVAGLVLKNLTELQISVRNSSDDRDDIFIMRELGKMKIPNLSILKLTSRIIFESGQISSIWYFNLYKFIAKYRKTLKQLEFRDGITFLTPNDLLNNNNVSSIVIPSTKLETLKNDLAQCQLTSLSVEFSQLEGYNQCSLGFHLLASQKKLSKLEICRDSELHPSFVYRVADAVEANFMNLTHVVFAYLSDLSLEEFTRISKALSMCCKIQILELMLFNYPSFPYPLPATVKNLMLVGSLDPILLVVVKQTLPLLETLQFHNVTADYGPREIEYVINLKNLITMSNLSSVLFSSMKMDYTPILVHLSQLVIFQNSAKDVCFFRLPNKMT